MFTQTCPECRGEGSVVKTPCTSCNGEGLVEKSRKVLVAFPAGIDTGQRLRVPGQGMPGNLGGPPGDLYVDVELAPDERFERDGSDLVTRGPISIAQAILGGSIVIELPDESTVTIDVPPGAQPNDVLTVKGKGVPRVDGRGRGSLQVVVQVAIPREITPAAKELLMKLDAELKPKDEPAKTTPSA
jgi:molecular chaperone DnaJ